jgi:hypothetical protein
LRERDLKAAQPKSTPNSPFLMALIMPQMLYPKAVTTAINLGDAALFGLRHDEFYADADIIPIGGSIGRD